MKNILKQVFIILFVALIVFFLFYNCSGKKEETPQQNAPKQEQKGGSELTSNCRELYLAALKHDSIILNATEVKTDEANAAIKAFADFSFYCKSDSLAPIFLLKAGQIATVINNMPQAQISFETIIKDFPNFKNRGAAMFLLAQLYDEQKYLNNEDKALELYNKIISTFPGSEWAKNADAARNLLGKTDEEIMKEFLKKNKKKK